MEEKKLLFIFSYLYQIKSKHFREKSRHWSSAKDNTNLGDKKWVLIFCKYVWTDWKESLVAISVASWDSEGNYSIQWKSYDSEHIRNVVVKESKTGDTS